MFYEVLDHFTVHHGYVLNTFFWIFEQLWTVIFIQTHVAINADSAVNTITN
jgi:hypothetical protein